MPPATLAQGFSCEFYEIFKNTIFEEYLRMASSVQNSINDFKCISWTRRSYVILILLKVSSIIDVFTIINYAKKNNQNRLAHCFPVYNTWMPVIPKNDLFHVFVWIIQRRFITILLLFCSTSTSQVPFFALPPLREKYPNTEFFWSVFSRIWTE